MGLKRLQLLESRQAAEGSLTEFVRQGWRNIDPAPYVPGWHLDAIAEHLEAVTYGEIRRLIINVPPRTSKSSMTSVAWPAWVWALQSDPRFPLAGPGVQWLFSSYAQTLAIRDSVKCRRLIQSPWYQARWAKRFGLSQDQNAKVRFENDQGGYRLATSVDGSLTGEGGMIVVVDDPHNAVEAESEAVRRSTVDWWDQAMSTRLNDPKIGAYVVIMQRLHEDDLTGHILAREHQDWTHLCLPMEYEADRHCSTSIGWDDPRSQDGDLLCPERFDETAIRRLKSSLGPYGAAGQLQQRPEPKGGGILKREWWQLWEEPTFPACDWIIASLDTAYTEKQENDPSALTIWGVFADTNRGGLPAVVLMSAWQERLDISPLVEKVAATCRRFKVDTLLVEGKASGLSVNQELRRLHSTEGFSTVIIDPKNLDKVARAYSVQHVFSEGQVYAPERSWADMVIDQCASFPKAKHDDLVDTTTQALRYLRTAGLLTRSAEQQREMAEAAMHKPQTAPLYPV